MLCFQKNKKKFNIFGLDILKPDLDQKSVNVERFTFIKKDLTKIKQFKIKKNGYDNPSSWHTVANIL